MYDHKHCYFVSYRNHDGGGPGAYIATHGDLVALRREISSLGTPIAVYPLVLEGVTAETQQKLLDAMCALAGIVEPMLPLLEEVFLLGFKAGQTQASIQVPAPPVRQPKRSRGSKRP